MSFRELAGKIGKAPSTIQSWEQGKRLPDLDDLFVLANVLEAELNELISLAAAPLKDLEKRLAAAEDRERKASREASRTGAGAGERLAAVEAGREAAFLRNLIAQRQKQERRTRSPKGIVPLYDLKRVPVMGEIRAGQPRLTLEGEPDYTGVPRDVDVDYALTVEGDSMIGAGIAPGDVVWVRRADFANHGSAVVALLEGREVTIKHLVKEEKHYVLRANNPGRDYPDIFLGPEDRIIGVVQRVVKRPGPPPR
jgi:repressor LexA